MLAGESETREQHTKRIVSWVRQIYKLDAVKVPPALRVDFQYINIFADPRVTQWDVSAFNDAIQ